MFLFLVGTGGDFIYRRNDVIKHRMTISYEWWRFFAVFTKFLNTGYPLYEAVCGPEHRAHLAGSDGDLVQSEV
jgi:hypothetical protein